MIMLAYYWIILIMCVLFASMCAYYKGKSDHDEELQRLRMKVRNLERK